MSATFRHGTLNSPMLGLTILVTLYGSLGIPVVGLAATGTWSQLSPYPTPITNNAVTSVCNAGTCTIYSFMGMTDPTDSNTITATSYKLTSPGTGGWVQIADAPMLNGLAKIAASAVTCNGEVYLIGGYTVAFITETTEQRFFRYNPNTDDYTQLANVPTEVDDTVVGVYQDRYIYLISGWHGPLNANTRAVQVYDTMTNTWQQATQLPNDVNGRFGHAGGLVGGQITFIDGSRVGANFPIDHSTVVGTIDANDVTSITWQQPGPSPFSQTYRAANSIGALGCDRILFVGGTDNPYNFDGQGYNGQPSNPLNQAFIYEPSLDKWSLVEDSAGTHTLTMDHRGLVLFDDKWVIVGGMTGPGSPTNLVQAMSISGACDAIKIPTTSAWTMLILTLGILVTGSIVLTRRKGVGMND